MRTWTICGGMGERSARISTRLPPDVETETCVPHHHANHEKRREANAIVSLCRPHLHTDDTRTPRHLPVSGRHVPDPRSLLPAWETMIIVIIIITIIDRGAQKRAQITVENPRENGIWKQRDACDHQSNERLL